MDLAEQIVRFCVAGLGVTAVDFLGYNLYLRYVSGGGRVDRVVASMLSVTLAMAVSFSLNRLWVFGELNAAGWPVVRFLAVTLTSAYGIQSLVIYLLSMKRRIPARFIETLNEIVPRRKIFDAEVIERNAVKVAAVGCGLVWNFSWYKLYVFL